VPVLGFLMFLAMINMRFDIILYTRAVNAVRDYFSMRAAEINVRRFRNYLKLPTDKNKPPYFEGFSRSYTWIFILMGLLNSSYSLILLKNLATRKLLPFLGPWRIALGVFLLHVLSYWWFSWMRTRKEVLGIKNDS
jgi:hypothetical protein